MCPVRKLRVKQVTISDRDCTLLLYQRDEDDEWDGPLILEHGELLSHEDLDGVSQVVHRLLGRVQVQDLDRHIVGFLMVSDSNGKNPGENPVRKNKVSYDVFCMYRYAGKYAS